MIRHLGVQIFYVVNNLKIKKWANEIIHILFV